MSLNIATIKEGAFLVSDAHYSSSHPQLKDFLKSIQENKLVPTQLIFMGDIFDSLFGAIEGTYPQNQEVIEMINKISLNIEVIYLEGNHDFNLKKIFLNTKVYSIQEQPVLFELDNKKIYLAHGDFVGGVLYKIYTAFARNKIMLYILNILNKTFNNFILTVLYEYLSKKDNCTEIENFDKIIKNRLLDKYECEYFIEGHFHQNKFIKFDNYNYFNLAAFACNQRYFVVKSFHKELLAEMQYSKEK